MTKVFVTGTRGIPGVMGGVETHCEELYPRLVKRGVDVTLARRSTYVNEVLKEWKGIKLVDIPSLRKKNFEAIIHTFWAINKAKRRGAEIVHIHAIGPALLAPWARLLGMKVVLTHHGPDYDRDKWGFVAKTMLKLGERLGCKYANDIIVISDVVKNLIKDKYGRTERVHLIYNGAAVPEKCSYPSYFKDLNIEEGKYILATSRFIPEKNLHHLIEAFVSIKKKPEGMKLVLAGDTEFEDAYSRSLIELARKNNVVLTGFIKGKEMHSLLTHCRAYCLPSSHEGLSISLLEAMSYGVKVVVSDIPANLEVGLDEECYFPCGDISALSQKLEKIISEPLQHVNYDMSKYDWEKIADQIKEVYEDC